MNDPFNTKRPLYYLVMAAIMLLVIGLIEAGKWLWNWIF